MLGKSLISLKQGNVTNMELLARSLDCYLIEHIWEEWGRAITSMDNPPQNLGELRQALLDNWAEMSVQLLQRLVASTPRSLAAIIAVRCRNTQYRPGIHNTTPTGNIMQKNTSLLDQIYRNYRPMTCTYAYATDLQYHQCHHKFTKIHIKQTHMHHGLNFFGTRSVIL